MTKPAEPVTVAPRVVEALEMVRHSGLTNMLDRRTVAMLAEEFGYPDAADWIRTHRAEYATGIFNGFRSS